jgi:hypothetical protein
LYWKDLLVKLEDMSDEQIDEYVQEHTLSTPLSEYEWIEEMTQDET